MKRLKISNSFSILEPVSALSHLAGAVLALAAMAALITRSISQNEQNLVLHITAYTIYGLSMFCVFMASATYHGLPTNRSRKRTLNRIDHAMIYVFIAGSYYPLFLLGTPREVGVPIVAAVTLLAVVGVCLEFFAKEKGRKWGALAYVLMGWISVFGMKSLMDNLPMLAIYLVVGGGALYTIGALCYALKEPNPFPRFFGFHEIFHFFVLAGCICQLAGIWLI